MSHTARCRAERGARAGAERVPAPRRGSKPSGQPPLWRTATHLQSYPDLHRRPPALIAQLHNTWYGHCCPCGVGCITHTDCVDVCCLRFGAPLWLSSLTLLFGSPLRLSSSAGKGGGGQAERNRGLAGGARGRGLGAQ